MRLLSRAAREYRRSTIVRLHESGHKQSEIADVLEVDQSVVSRVLQAHRSGASLAEKVNKGAPCRLSGQQLSELGGLIQRGASYSGFESDHWSGPRLARLVRDRFGVAYSPSGILKVVQRMGFSKQRYRQKDRRQPGAHTWYEEKLPAIKKKPWMNSAS